MVKCTHTILWTYGIIHHLNFTKKHPYHPRAIYQQFNRPSCKKYYFISYLLNNLLQNKLHPCKISKYTLNSHYTHTYLYICSIGELTKIKLKSCRLSCPQEHFLMIEKHTSNKLESNYLETDAAISWPSFLSKKQINNSTNSIIWWLWSK